MRSSSIMADFCMLGVDALLHLQKFRASTKILLQNYWRYVHIHQFGARFRLFIMLRLYITFRYFLLVLCVLH
jgi:hypothetical protein